MLKPIKDLYETRDALHLLVCERQTRKQIDDPRGQCVKDDCPVREILGSDNFLV